MNCVIDKFDRLYAPQVVPRSTEVEPISSNDEDKDPNIQLGSPKLLKNKLTNKILNELNTAMLK